MKTTRKVGILKCEKLSVRPLCLLRPRDRVLYTTFRGLDSARSIFEKWISDGNKGRFGTFSEASPLCGEETQCNSLSHSLISDCQDSQDKDLLVGSDWVRREG